jgi:hypothetical protein
MNSISPVLEYSPLYLDILKWVGIAALSVCSFPIPGVIMDNGFVTASRFLMWLMGMVFFIQILISGKVLTV